MALNKAGLVTALTDIFEDNESETSAAEKADQIATAIDNYVKTATVATTVTVVSVSGVTTGPGVSGPGAGTGTGTLS